MVGEISTEPAPVADSSWKNVLFLQSYLARTYFELDQNCQLVLPGSSDETKVPLCRLEEIGSLGYDARDIEDAFEYEMCPPHSPYPAFLESRLSKSEANGSAT